MISTMRRAVVLLVATFVLGVSAGIAGTTWYWRQQDQRASASRAGWYLAHLTHSLDLSTSQQDSVKAVLDRYGPSMDSLMDQIRPRLDTVRTAMRTEIARFLDPRQQKEYDAMRQHDRERKAGGTNARP
jgi:hypothetical protein